MKTGTAQSFLESTNTSVSPQHEAFNDGLLDHVDAEGICTCACRCGRSPIWRPRGRKRSKSFTAMRTGISELSGWDWEPRQEPQPISVEPSKDNGPGEAPLEGLPAEILGERGQDLMQAPVLTILCADEIIAQLALSVPPAGYTPRNVDLISCLLVSRTVHVATINTLYNHITIPHSQIFAKFMSHISDHPGLGTLVRRLDLSHFTSVGLGRTRQMNAEIQNMTARTLLQCLQFSPNLKEVLLQEHLDEDIDERVLRKLLFGLPKLKAVDFCAAASASFVSSLASVVRTLNGPASTDLNIQRLGLHECFTLQSSAFEGLLPRMPRLTHLDVAHTRITDRALASIPRSAQLTHLNLGRCTQLTGEGVVDFLTSHPAATGLVYLNLSCDIASYRLLSESDITRLLPTLPKTLRSLNLNGAKIRPVDAPAILPLTKHLEELSLAHSKLSLQDINSFFRRPPPTNSGEPAPAWTPPTLHYLDLSHTPSITQPALYSSNCNLLSQTSSPLEVLELGDKVISSLRECRNTNKRLGWVVKELGRRGWYVREPSGPDAGNGSSNGRRGWKMGAMWWGMRKCPVAVGEVGGLYGHYMFKK